MSMKNESRKRLLFALFLITLISCADEKAVDFTDLKGPYLGQKPPGKIPEIFAPGIVSTGFNERIAAFTPDGKEFHYVLYGAPHMVILFTKEENGRWTKPRVAPFSGKYSAEFNISPDGNKIVFGSFQPIEGQGPESEIGHTWIVERKGTGWSEPKPLRPALFGYPSLSLSGNLYVNPIHEDGLGGEDVYVSKLIDGQYAEPENLGDQVNSEIDEIDPFIAPDESYIIFLRRDPEGFGGTNLFISFRKGDGSWTKAKNMGEPINSSAYEICPSISPDGKYFFFTSNRSLHKPCSEMPLTHEEKIRILNSPGNGLGDIYWADAKIIEDLKPKELK
ncbi:hypothetical protein ACFLRM_03080 [Acidobacteriota bacterium]